MKKTLPRAFGIREANRTKTRQKNAGSIFATSFRNLRKNVLVVFLHSSEKLQWQFELEGKAASSEVSLNLVPYLNMPAPRSHHLLIITDCYS